MSHIRTKEILESSIPDALLDQVSGDVPRRVKEMAVKWLAIFRSGGFGNSIGHRPRVTEVSVKNNPDHPVAKEGRIVCELDVTEDMLNEDGILHNGCVALLIDEISTTSIVVLKEALGISAFPGVTQVMNVTFHNPAKLGTRLRIIGTNIAVGGAMMPCRCEIWDSENDRRVASGVQLQMRPLRPPPSFVALAAKGRL